jgi:exopolyphosphatase / guanosine-5'-triphosphate,3'-diphosphate pyrophosphatase
MGAKSSPSSLSPLLSPGRLAVEQPVAIVDIGSNSVRLVVYEGLSRAPTPLYNEKVMCGLGRGVTLSGTLEEKAVARALKAMARFRLLCEMMQVSQIRILATAAAREAENGPDFLREAQSVLRHEIELLTGEREAELSALGVLSGFPDADGLVGDLGGGSLELIEVRNGSAGRGISLPLGGLALQDLSEGHVRRAQKFVREALQDAQPLRFLKGRSFYAVGGTWRAIAKLHMAARDYPLRVMHGYSVAPQEELNFLSLVEEKDAQSLKEIDTVSEGRRPLLSYGALVMGELLRIGQPEQIVLSALGVREGLLYEMLTPLVRREDPLLGVARDLNHLRSRDPEHGEDLIRWTDAFFRGSGLSETSQEKRLRHAACLLADIGWRAHPDYRGEQSLNLIAHAAFIGIDHPGRAYLALAVFFRHEGLSSDRVSARLRDLAGPRLTEQARLLAGLMRVAYPVSAGIAGTLGHTGLVLDKKHLVLTLPSLLADLVSERLNNRMKALGKLLGAESQVSTDGTNPEHES